MYNHLSVYVILRRCYVSHHLNISLYLSISLHLPASVCTCLCLLLSSNGDVFRVISATTPAAEEIQRRAIYAQQMLLNRQAELHPSNDITPPVTVSAYEATSSTSNWQQPLRGATHYSNSTSPHRAVAEGLTQSEMATNKERTPAMTSDVTSLTTSAAMLDDESRRQRRRGKCYKLINDQEGQHSKIDSGAITTENTATKYPPPQHQVPELPIAESTSYNAGLITRDNVLQLEAGSNFPLRTEATNSTANVRSCLSLGSSATPDVVGHGVSVGREARRPRVDTGRGGSTDATANRSVVSDEQAVTPLASSPASVAVSSNSMSTANADPASVCKKQYNEASSRTAAPAAATTSPTITRRSPRTSALSTEHRSTGVTSHIKEVMSTVSFE